MAGVCLLSDAFPRAILPPCRSPSPLTAKSSSQPPLPAASASSPEEIVERALETIAEQEPAERKKTPAEAVTHIRESRKGVTLGGLKIKDLIHEGHKY